MSATDAASAVPGATDPASLAAAAGDLAARLAGKYMTFRSAGEIYGLEILKVREIIGVMDITRVPRAASCVRGVINLRGKVIPVVDLRLEFGLEPCQTGEQTVIIVVQCAVAARLVTMGLLVDEVLEVLSIQPAQIEPPPELAGASAEGQFILGIGKAGERVVFLLDAARVLGTGALAA